MSGSGKSNQNTAATSAAVDISIQLGVLILVIICCYLILKPFIPLVTWGIILAVALYPVYHAVNAKLGNRRKLTAAILTIAALLVIILPGIQMAGSGVDGLQLLNDKLKQEELKIPPPPEKVKEWWVIGSTVYTVWQQASVNLEATLQRYQPQVTAAVKWLLSTAVDTVLGVVMFAVSIIIAGILMTTAHSGGQVARHLFVRLVGDRGSEFVDISEQTIRGVVKGILGVAVIQALLAGLGFWIAGIPGAGVWAFLSLVLAIVQIGIGPVVLGVIIYAFSNMSTLPAVVLTVYLVVLTVYLIVVAIGDGPLKAIFLGRGAAVPMAVIFLGAIGGFIWIGFLGLFIGAVILSLSYILFKTWMGDDPDSSGIEEDSEPKSSADYAI
ncbi:Permease of the drug/metabolite transporter (DMT) superfamily [Olavius algarvensis associated proteobacterium Delta 3]|nr:Permease of the drug/metabolite transporter (DMT) superfamily [Olavius algarvensis associated proteobacterium Delta 3]